MNIDRITFQSVVPQVFESQKEALHSEVWNRELTFEKGKLYLIEAASGRGKSTFCSYVLGYRHDYSGQVLFNDVPTSTFKVRDWVEARRLHISHLFQELRLFPELTAFENIVIKNKLTNFKSQEQIATWFEQLGIADKMHERIGRMSFGQQQRVALIRALVQPFLRGSGIVSRGNGWAESPAHLNVRSVLPGGFPEKSGRFRPQTRR